MIDSRTNELDRLLMQAREAEAADRISLRDPIAAHGDLATEVMTDWIGDPRLAAFAIRVLERIGREPAQRQNIVDMFQAVDRTLLPPHLARDIDQALLSLGHSTAISRGRRQGTERPVHDQVRKDPGVDGRGYWAMRTSPWERPYVWAEAQHGRLRQGWGWAPEQDLERIADAVHAGRDLSEEQLIAWPSRRMLSTESDGMQTGDIILAPNIPDHGQVCLFRLIGSYVYAPDTPRRFEERFGHVLQVELLAGPIDRWDASVSDALRSTLRNPGRLWSIRPYGGDVERLLGRGHSTPDSGAPTAQATAEPEADSDPGSLERRGDDLLASIGARAAAIGDRPLTLHWPTVGAAFDHGVLVVGQAVYGWMNSWTAKEATDSQIRARIIAGAKNPFPHLRDPMDWIDGHRAQISPFWTVARHVTDEFTPGEAPWFSRLAWMNLYPVAPNDVKANPEGALRESQSTAAAAFLKTAIRVIEPRLVLVVGGPYVWPFVEPLGLDVLEAADNPLYRVGRRNGVPWVVGMHPAGASRRGWGSNQYAQMIIAAARSELDLGAGGE